MSKETNVNRNQSTFEKKWEANLSKKNVLTIFFAILLFYDYVYYCQILKDSTWFVYVSEVVKHFFMNFKDGLNWSSILKESQLMWRFFSLFFVNSPVIHKLQRRLWILLWKWTRRRNYSKSWGVQQNKTIAKKIVLTFSQMLADFCLRWVL